MTPNRRKPIPNRTKAIVMLRQNGICACGCGTKLPLGDTEYDHSPALIFREWSEESQDTIPPANDPDHIFALTKSCHKRKSFGTKATCAGSDIHVAGKIRRLTGQNKSKPKYNWPTRKMQSRGFGR